MFFEVTCTEKTEILCLDGVRYRIKLEALPTNEATAFLENAEITICVNEVNQFKVGEIYRIEFTNIKYISVLKADAAR